MSQSIYCNPSLIIDNVEIPYSFDFTIDNRGNNSINKASIAIKSNVLNNSKFHNKEVCIYMNNGSIDSVPQFRGYIRTVTPSDKDLKLVALDPRCFLAGDNTPDVNTTLFEGHTLAQFTNDWIKRKVNKDKVFIGLDMLNETTPVQPFFTEVPLSIVSKAYDIIKMGINLNTDKEAAQFKRYEVVMIDDGIKSNIHFLRDKNIDGPSAIRFTDTDGIISISYKKTPTPTFAMIGDVRYQIGSEPLGPHQLRTDYLPPLEAFEETPAEIQDMVIEHLEMHRIWNEKRITLNATKGHYLNIGDIVSLDVEDDEIRGKHKVTSKRLSFTKTRMSVTLTLNKRQQAIDESD